MSRTLVIACVIAAGCSAEQSQIDRSSADSERMAKIVQIATASAAGAPHRELLERGNVFVDIADLDVPCVGLRVPLPGTENHAFVSFTKAWFDEHTDHEVATALVEDLQKALSAQD